MVRRHLRPDLQVDDWASVAPVVDELLARPLPTLEALERWVYEINELFAAIWQVATERNAAVLADAEDAQARERFHGMASWLATRMDPARAQMLARLLDHPLASRLPAELGEYLRRAEDLRATHDDANAELQVQEVELVGEYGQLVSSWAIELEGERRPASEAGPILRGSDRTARERVFHQLAEDRARTADRIDAIVHELLEIRRRIARNAGFPDYRAYVWRGASRRYGPDTASAMIEAIETSVVPRLTREQERLRHTRSLPRLRPWDTRLPRAPLPTLPACTSSEELLALVRASLTSVEPSLGDAWDELVRTSTLDLEPRRGKLPGARHAMLPETRSSILSIDGVTDYPGLMSLVHEAAHALHARDATEQPLFGNQQVPREFAELTSLSMELLTTARADVWLGSKHAAQAALLDHLHGALVLLAAVARDEVVLDACYAGPPDAPVQLAAQWRAAFDRFSGAVDWTGLEAERASAWHAHSHFVQQPFYNLEYAFAQLGALRLWQRYERDPSQCIDELRRAWRAGWTHPAEELYAMAGIPFDWSPSTVEDAMVFVDEQLSRLVAS